MKFCIDCRYYIEKNRICNVMNIDMVTGKEWNNTEKPAAIMRHSNNPGACGHEARFFDAINPVQKVTKVEEIENVTTGDIEQSDMPRKRGRPKAIK